VNDAFPKIPPTTPRNTNKTRINDKFIGFFANDSQFHMKLTDPVIKAAKPKEKPCLLPDGHWTCITGATFRRQMVVLQVPIQSCFRLLLLRFVFVLGGVPSQSMN